MAIFHLVASTGTRAPARGTATSRDQSASAHASYLCRLGRYAQPSRDALQYVEAGNMPSWSISDHSGTARAAALEYWKSADKYERKNARLFKSVEFALPVELSRPDQIKLARAFVRNHLASTPDGLLPFLLVLHQGHGGHNPHCHALISERINDGHTRTPQSWFSRASTGQKPVADGGAKKTRSLMPKAWLDGIRQSWATLANLALQKAGLATRIDHRSNVDRGLTEVAGEHLGPHASALERRTGRRSRRGHDIETARPAIDLTLTDEIEKIEAEIRHLKRARSATRFTQDLSIFQQQPIPNPEGEADENDDVTPAP